jgi:hypothetical protein
MNRKTVRYAAATHHRPAVTTHRQPDPTEGDATA